MTSISKRFFSSLMLLLLLGSMFLGPVKTAHAAISTINVTSGSADVFGNSPKICSLREAIWAVNHHASFDGCLADSSTNTIFLPTGNYQLKIAGSEEDQGRTGDLDILVSMKIFGSGAGEGQTRIFADNNVTSFLDRIFHVKGSLNSQGKPAITVELQYLRISGGYTTNVGGGGILNESANLNLSGVYLERNEVYGGGTWGGGIKNAPNSVLTVDRSTFEANHAYFGGAISNLGIVTLKNSLMVGNTASGAGGGLDNNPQYKTTGLATIINTTISGNTSIDSGAGISNSGNLVLTNSTIADNLGYGVLINGDKDSLFTAKIQNTIIARHDQKLNCAMSSSTARLITGGYNLIDSRENSADPLSKCAFKGANSGGTDLLKTDPLLSGGLLNESRSPTLYYKFLLPYSPAIDVIPVNNPNCPATDQRGYSRPGDGNKDGEIGCDIGAFEEAGIAPDKYKVYLPSARH